MTQLTLPVYDILDSERHENYTRQLEADSRAMAIANAGDSYPALARLMKRVGRAKVADLDAAERVAFDELHGASLVVSRDNTVVPSSWWSTCDCEACR